MPAAQVAAIVWLETLGEFIGMEEEMVEESRADGVFENFVGDVARYFKLYLETGLHTQLEPMRKSSAERTDGLTTQLRLSPYQQLNKNLYKNLVAGIAQESFVVSQNKYTTHIDEGLGSSFEAIIRGVNETRTGQLSTALAKAIDTARLQSNDNRDAYHIAVLEQMRSVLVNELVVPIIRQTYADAHNSDTDHEAQQLTDTAIHKVLGELQPTLSDLALGYYDRTEQDPATLAEAIRTTLTVQTLRAILRSLLNDLTVSDAYQKIYELHLSNQARTDSDMYVYFGEITLRDTSFPLFYSVVRAEHKYPSVTLHFENRLFVNTRALEYILATYSQIVGQAVSFIEPIPRFIEIDPRNRKACLPQLQAIVNTLTNTFDVAKQLSLDSVTDQVVSNRMISLTNRLQLAVFNGLNESLVADYESLLEVSGRSGGQFADKLSEYVLETPVRYIEEVAEEWTALPLAEKLLSTNPLPLNDEQKQTLIALNKPGSQVVVDGAPGTGKTHLAASVALESFADGRSTLILSHSEDSLDSIQRSITKVLQAVRGKQPHHNPILRLSDISDTLLDEVEAPYLQKLTESQAAFARREDDLRAARNRKLHDATTVLNSLMQDAENINLQEVEQLVANEAHFGGRDWVHDEPIDEINGPLQELHQAITYLRSSEASYLMPYIEASQQKAIAEFVAAIREYERASKNVHNREGEFVLRFRKLLPAQKDQLESSLSYIHSNYREFIRALANDPITAPLVLNENTPYQTILEQQKLFDTLIVIAKGAKQLMQGGDKSRNVQLVHELISYSTDPQQIISAFEEYTNQVDSLKSKIFGFSGRTVVVDNLNKQLKKQVPEFTIEDPERHLSDLAFMSTMCEFLIGELAKQGYDLIHWKQLLHLLLSEPARVRELQKVLVAFVAPAEFEFMHPHRLYEADNLLANITLLEHATHLNTVLKTTPRLSTLFGIKSIGQVLAHPEMFRARFDKLANDLDDVKQLERCKATVKTFTKAYPDVMKRLGVAYVSGTLDIVNDTFINSSAEEIKEYLAYKKRVQDVVAYFSEMTGDTYGSLMSDLKQITATELSHKADKRLLNFVSEQPETFATIRNALRTGQSLTPGQFGGLRSIYPVILADVHNYSTYLPLKYGLIDLLIIDGAANIGIAEALPALLRAKKVLVLGDAKSSALFPNETIDHTLNDLHRDRLGRSFSATLQGVSADVKNQQLARLHQNFDVRQSVLGFARAAANYEIKLTKYFRSAPELISYVNKTFYGDTLRCLNARTEPLSDLIRFTHVKTAKGAEADLHTNIGEAKRIIEELTAMRQADYRGTIGIVTPYPQQALLLQKELDECVISDWFEKRQLKVMTLDTARGISRNYVFYSMVSNNAFDDLDHVLPGHPERLCAGLSRATEVVHFVLSKPIEEFSGASGDMLAHFQSKLSTGNVRTSSVSDVLMAAESLFPQYFYATGFYKKHRENAQLVTQFSLGDLTKALSSKVTYPPYKVDFLIALGRHRIIITYDEFKANFLSGSKDLQTNYLTTTDIYDQKILETYGYTFLRLNKFNLGSKPAETLNKLLQRATTQSSWARDNGFAE